MCVVHSVVLSDKGQLVIPKALRDKYGLAKGSKLVIMDEGGKLVLEPSDSVIEKLRVFQEHAAGGHSMGQVGEGVTLDGEQGVMQAPKARDMREIS